RWRVASRPRSGGGWGAISGCRRTLESALGVVPSCSARAPTCDARALGIVAKEAFIACPSAAGASCAGSGDCRRHAFETAVEDRRGVETFLAGLRRQEIDGLLRVVDHVAPIAGIAGRPCCFDQVPTLFRAQPLVFDVILADPRIRGTRGPELGARPRLDVFAQ